MKKKMIALSLGFMFLIAGFGISYDFDYNTFVVNSNEVKAQQLEDEMDYENNFKMNGREIDGECKWRVFNRKCNTNTY